MKHEKHESMKHEKSKRKSGGKHRNRKLEKMMHKACKKAGKNY